MPSLNTLLVFLGAAVTLVAIPGPNLIYIITRSVAQGRRAGVASALGVETGTLLHVLAAACGISVIVASSDLALDVIRYAGAAYLIYLGLRTLRQGHSLPSPNADSRAQSLLAAWRQGVLVQLLNPKVILFFLAFFPQFIDPDRNVASQVVVLGTVLATVGLAVDCVYALIAARMGMTLRRPELLQPISACIYIGLGVLAIIAGGSTAN